MDAQQFTDLYNLIFCLGLFTLFALGFMQRW